MIESAGLYEPSMAGFVISPVAVDPESFNPEVPPADLAEAGVPPGRETVGYMGTLTAWHGVDLFFDAARILRAEQRPVTILAVGGEPDRVQRLRARTREEGLDANLRFMGSIPHTMVPSYLAAVDVCLIPDTQDWSSPTKFFEFAAMEKPVVAALSPAVQEVFGDGEPVGLYFRRGDARDLVEKILQVLDDPKLADRLGRAARRRILRHYTWRSNIAKIMDLYRRMGVTEAQDPPPEVGA
jgi:glycosyltransferase involved in cell wall biosynthesis